MAPTKTAQAVPEKAQAALLELPPVTADLVQKMVKPVDLPKELLLQQVLAGEVGTLSCFACSGKAHRANPERAVTTDSRGKDMNMGEEKNQVTPFSHRAPNGVWIGYPPKLCGVIAAAMEANPEWGVVKLPRMPLEVRWGFLARSKRMPKPPATGIIQVNIKSGNTRVVRMAGGSVVANADSGAVMGWVFEDDSGGWSAYDIEMAAMLSQALRDGRAARVRFRGWVTLRTGAQREYEYEVDLATMTQRNLATNELRKIKRLDAAPSASAHAAPTFTATTDRSTDSCWVCMGEGKTSKWLPRLWLPHFDAEEFLRTKDDDEFQCVVCYGDAKYALSSSGCGHYFCDACIDGSLGMILDVGQFPAYCPQCRADGVLVDGRAATGRVDTDALAFLASRGACTKRRAVRIAQQDAKARGEASLECMVCPGRCGALLLTDHPSYRGLRIGEYYKAKVHNKGIHNAVCLAECPKCASTACVNCRQPAAPPHVCVNIRDIVGEATLEDLRLMVHIGKACPACGNFIIKNGGCDYMICGTDSHGSRDKALENGGCAHRFKWGSLAPLSCGAPGKPDNDRQVRFKVCATRVPTVPSEVLVVHLR